jgi:hypothetical protein
MCRFWDDPKYCDQHRSTSDEEGAEDHPSGEYIPEKQAGEERVP